MAKIFLIAYTPTRYSFLIALFAVDTVMVLPMKWYASNSWALEKVMSLIPMPSAIERDNQFVNPNTVLGSHI